MRIYNTLTRQKEEFTPVVPGEVRMYACGPTVYNYFHIGNARPLVVFDTLRRYFEYRGYKVTFVQNFTDIDDKMIARANQEGITVKELADKFISEYYTDADALNIKPATIHPRATDNMDAIIALIAKLVETGHAYAAGGDVYFDVSSDRDYGKLSGQSLDDLMMGARIEVGENKRNPMDFALWKAKKPDEPSWPSPWGEGRPGWHIECSAMSQKYLGETFDIHGGGVDLVFPHHENEIAQSECATGHTFARYWMHNGFINIDNKKMSKSAGNFFTVRDISKEIDLLCVRMFMLSAHYRTPVNFSRELLEQAKAALERMRNCREHLSFISQNGDESEDSGLAGLLAAHEAGFIEMMDDDLNTAGAIGAIFELIRDLNLRFESGVSKCGAAAALKKLDELAGVLGLTRAEASIPPDVSALAQERAAARKNRDFAQSDMLREKIRALGYEIKDTPDGYKLSRLM